MTLLEVAGLVAIIFIFGFAAAGIIIAIPLFRLLNRVKFLTEILNKSLIPLIEKLNCTVNNLDTEIRSIGNLTQSMISIIKQLEKIVSLIQVLHISPIVKLISTSVGLVNNLKK
jgi:hypothetical protein